jgi:predicted AAA+ superfamily ATPase
LKDLPDALPGRAETIELWPLSQGEIDSAAAGFVDAVFRCSSECWVSRIKQLPKDDVSEDGQTAYLAIDGHHLMLPS